MSGSAVKVTNFIIVTNGEVYRLWDTINRKFHTYSHINSFTYGQPVEYETKEQAKKMAQKLTWAVVS